MIQKIVDAERRPLVTVLVTTRNMEAQIRECLSGLMEQTIANRMEVVVVDQGSEQCEWAVIADLQRRHHNLISLRVPAGAACGIDLALKMASGRYLTVLAATDRMKEDAYERLAAALDGRPDAALAYGDTCFTTSSRPRFESSNEQAARPGTDAAAPHPMWRREVHDSVGGFGEIGEFFAKVAHRFPVVHLPEVTGLQFVEKVADPDQALAQVASSVRGDDRQQAVKVLEQHLESYPDHAIAHNNLAALCYQLGDADKALLHYRKAVQLAPAETTYRKNLADVLYMEGAGVDEAISIYLELLKQSPKDVETLFNLGIICEGVGQPTEAESFYLSALEIEPSNQSVRERLGQLHAQEPAQVAQPATPRVESAEERYQKALALVEQGDQEGALRELEGIVSTYPEFPAAHNDLAVLSYQNGAKEKALIHYEKAAALDPDNSIFQKNLADFYFVEGRNIDGAIGIYLEQLRREPGDVETLMNLGNICVMLDRPQEAQTFYGKVTELEPWNMAARECLSNVRNCVNG